MDSGLYKQLFYDRTLQALVGVAVIIFTQQACVDTIEVKRSIILMQVRLRKNSTKIGDFKVGQKNKITQSKDYKISNITVFNTI